MEYIGSWHCRSCTKRNILGVVRMLSVAGGLRGHLTAAVYRETSVAEPAVAAGVSLAAKDAVHTFPAWQVLLHETSRNPALAGRARSGTLAAAHWR